jgi:hypothetical protein
MGFLDRMKQGAKLSAESMKHGMPSQSDVAETNAYGQEMRRLWAEGEDGRATIKSATDTGERMAGNTVLDLDLSVNLAAGDTYDTTLRMPIAGSDTGPYAPGTEYNVKVDRSDRSKLVFSA